MSTILQKFSAKKVKFLCISPFLIHQSPCGPRRTTKANPANWPGSHPDAARPYGDVPWFPASHESEDVGCGILDAPAAGYSVIRSTRRIRSFLSGWYAFTRVRGHSLPSHITIGFVPTQGKEVRKNAPNPSIWSISWCARRDLNPHVRNAH